MSYFKNYSGYSLLKGNKNWDTSETKIKTWVIFMDPGEDIDDEILAFILMKLYPENIHCFFVCVPGMSKNVSRTQNEINITVDERLNRLRTIFQEEFSTDNTYFPLKTICKSMRNHLIKQESSCFTICAYDAFFAAIDDYVEICNENFIIDELFQIAPLWNIDAERFNKIEIKKRIVMGDLTNPHNSINLKKGFPNLITLSNPIDQENLRKLIENYDLQESILNSNSLESISIPTDIARKVPIPFSLLKTFPEQMRKTLLNTAFKQMIGRPPVTFTWAYSISEANYKTILSTLNGEQCFDIIMNNGINLVPLDIYNTIYYQVHLFTRPDESSNFSPNMVPDFNLYKNRLIGMAVANYLITKIPYKTAIEPEKQQFNEDFLENKTKAKENWFRYIQKNSCNLSPLYDGLTWVVHEFGYLPTIMECKEKINELF